VHALPQGRQGRESRLSGNSWFVINVADAQAFVQEGLGSAVPFEDDEHPFDELGFNIQVLQPGQPNAMYHAENQQEDFLVLHGECLLLIEEEERKLRAWDFVHSSPGTKHVFVGAGDGPCAILMVGTRKGEAEELFYPRSELALKHGAGVEEETSDPRVAHARFAPSRPGAIPPSGLPWQR
jgi:uncharacterized cupin superfamily protein